MTTVSSVCEKCGAKIPADARQGVCPACQLETGLGLFANEAVAGGVDPGGDDGMRAPDRKKVIRQPRIFGDFGDYEVQEEIGRGGQAVVYRARQKSLNRTVALKVIGLGHWATEAHLKRFRREAEAAASLEHPCIVPIYEVGERDGSCYFSMQFIDGGQLDEVVRREPVPPRRVAELMAKVAHTVHHAHERGILHRDIKPGNILLDKNAEPHLTDFGLARLLESESSITDTLDVLGTPSYMAPEQAVGNNAAVSSATDVYGLGAVLYQLLTHHPPFAGGTTYETVRLVLDTEPRHPRAWNPKIDRDLATICLKCLDKDPKRRYASALALAEDLERWLKHEPIRAHRSGVFTRGRKWVRRNPSIAVMAAMLLVMTIPLGVMIWKSETEQVSTSNLAAPEKSIAVLPFENLSEEKANEFFADGVQDEILTDLARIADLKVISRTSVMHYKSGAARNLHEIGRQLGVANVVEGSVQRAGNRVRVNAQLVDARTDRHLWAQTYDRDLTDVFAIQSEIAKTIAEQLQAKLSPSERTAIEQAPTTDIAAFDLYIRGKNLIQKSGFSGTAKSDLLKAVDLLNQAVTRDPSFLQGYCQLALAYDGLYSRGIDHTSARLTLAEEAIQAAVRLRPDAGETHLARANHFYAGYLDYDRALSELELARQTLPNESEIFAVMGYIHRRQGRWEESTRDLERAVELDPRNVLRLQQIAWANYHYFRRYAEEKSVWDRILAIVPDDVDAKVGRPAVDLDWKADTRPLHQAIDSIRATNPAATQNIANIWLVCALAEHDSTAARNAVIASGENALRLGTDEVAFSRPFIEGVIARMTKDDEKARSAFTAARAEQEKIVQAQPNYGPALCVLSLIDAGLGRKEEALREGRRAVELLPPEKDAVDGPVMIKYLAMIAAWVGDKDLACEQLESIIRRPSLLSYGELKLMPFWDPLRGDPRFEKLVEEAKEPLPPLMATTVPEKSIAVLPFENLSDDKQNAYFADGVQDEILTDLSRIADLKVISRVSVMPYKAGAARNLRQIGKELGVANVLEGSVQRASNRVRVNAQLVDARTDGHLWAQTYDRDLADVFAIQSEIAQSIASQLQAKISPGEKATIEEQPTKDLAAYDAYVRAGSLIEDAWDPAKDAKKVLSQAVDLLNSAVKRDPAFALAYCRLAEAHTVFYFQGGDPTPARLALSKAAIDAAFRLKPDLGEAHLALAHHLYYGYLDYDRARDELAIAQRTLPNNAWLFALACYIDRRQSRWHNAMRNGERAMELDPRNAAIFNGCTLTYDLLRQFKRSRELDERQRAIDPNTNGDYEMRAFYDLHERADARAYRTFLEEQFAKEPASAWWPGELFYIALCERDFVAAEQALNALARLREDKLRSRAISEIVFSRVCAQGLLARTKGDAAAAQTAFTAARAQQEQEVLRKEPSDPSGGRALCILGLIDAGLGRKQDALREGRRAIELTPLEKNSFAGADTRYFYAVICAWTGERDAAIKQLQDLTNIPIGLTYDDLKLSPYWDSLRGDPRFEKIVEEARQPVALK